MPLETAMCEKGDGDDLCDRLNYDILVKWTLDTGEERVDRKKLVLDSCNNNRIDSSFSDRTSRPMVCIPIQCQPKCTTPIGVANLLLNGPQLPHRCLVPS